MTLFFRKVSSIILATSSSSHGKIIHLNHAGASPCSPAVLNRVISHLRLEQEIGGYAAAAEVDKELDAVYQQVAALIHAKPSQIALTESATVAWTRLFYAFCQYQEEQQSSSSSSRKKKQRKILVSQIEYAANLVAAAQWCKTHENWSMSMLPSDEHGLVDCRALEKELWKDNDDDDPAILLVTHVPTNSGLVNPVQEIGQLVANYNDKRQQQQSPSLLYLVDTCQSIGQMPVHVDELHCHGLVATGRKFLRGPRGTGFLYIDDNFDCMPHHVDHFGVPVQSVPKDSIMLSSQSNNNLQDILDYAPRKDARRFEFWESNIAAKLGLGLAIQQAIDYGLDRIRDDIVVRANHLSNRLANLPFVKLHHCYDKTESTSSSGIVTFQVIGMSSEQIKRELWKPTNDDGIRFEVAVVPATSTPLDSAATKVPDLVRASVSYTTTIQEMDAFCDRLLEIVSSSQQETVSD